MQGPRNRYRDAVAQALTPFALEVFGAGFLRADWQPLTPVEVRTVMHVCRPRLTQAGRYAPRDAPNLVAASKGLFDALTQMRVIPDDGKRHMPRIVVEVRDHPPRCRCTAGSRLDVTVQESPGGVL